MSARLRRTFHYPSDDDDDALAPTEVLDEQEQETLITNLASENHQRNTSFLRLLSTLPALSSIPFLLGLFLPPPTNASSHHTTLCLIGLSSLLATGWLLFRQDITETGFPFLDRTRTTNTAYSNNTNPSRGADYSSGYGYGLSQNQTHHNNKRPPPGGILGTATTTTTTNQTRSPLERHLPWLNLALASLSLLMGLLERAKAINQYQISITGVSPLLLGALPGVVYASVVGAKVVMAGVDPERELSGLKYAYKGA
ncbi:hypothetical protein N658DRAFT_449264 [Parathielavia hyrcaniae]|uniref:Uncharacterized protein n=1 Tax=Parathielavia hyrcaniae TaxID=113614 RepID=A0AAN6T2B6_9PEZI|nr:hypothetical protein N658DRAFT_449264 [Parathielavia hyrcaniae]